MSFVLGGVAIVYALLSMFAAAVQMRTAKRKDTPAMMLCGGLVFVIDAVLYLAGEPSGWAFAAVGGVLICIAAFLNGKRGAEFHASHHVIRLAVTVVLVAGFLLL